MKPRREGRGSHDRRDRPKSDTPHRQPGRWRCYGCERQAVGDVRPWLLITGWRGRVPVAVLLGPDCEDGHARVADELLDLIGVRLTDNSDASVRTVLGDWPTLPVKGR